MWSVGGSGPSACIINKSRYHTRLTPMETKSLMDHRWPNGKKAGPLPDDKMIPYGKAEVWISFQPSDLYVNRPELLLKPRYLTARRGKTFLLFRWHVAPQPSW
jgi:hypothetical protein